MFVTWKYDPKDDEVNFSTQARTFDPVAARTSGGAKACFHCRAKKQKCDGDANGCRRCQMHGRKCSYVETVKQKRLSVASSSKDRGRTDMLGSTGTSASSTGSTASLSPLANTQQHQQSQSEPQSHPGPKPPSKTKPKSQPQSQPQPELQSHPPPRLQDEEQQYTDEDVDWLMSPSPNINFFSECGLLEHTSLQNLSDTLVEDLHSMEDPSNLVTDGASSLSDDSSILHAANGVSGVAEVGLLAGSRSTATCQCLRHIVMVMDKLDMGDYGIAAAEESLISLLVLLKAALCSSSDMLGCKGCTARLENMMVLAMLMDKLARFCHSIAHRDSGVDESERPTQTLSLGDYQIDSTEEYTAVIWSLLSVHLRRLQTLSQRLQHISSSFHSAPLAQRLGVCDKLVNLSLCALRSVNL